MDLFHFNGLKTEKSVVMFWFKCLRTLVELIVALALLFWTFNRLPLAVRLSGEFFRRIVGVIVSPLFVFLLGNAIVVTLLIKSGRFSGENRGASNADAELCEEFVNDSENRSSRLLSENQLALVPREDIVYQDKEMISQVNAITHSNELKQQQSSGGDSDSDDDSPNYSDADTPKTYRRTKSEKFMKENAKVKLRRSETEMCRKTKMSSDDESNPEDELSNEEFQKAVEEFIEKHLKFRRQETLSIVPQNQNQTMFSNFNEIEIK